MQNDHNQPHQFQQKLTSTTPKTLKEWKTHWKAQEQDWRTEPEINAQRQVELTKYRNMGVFA